MNSVEDTEICSPSPSPALCQSSGNSSQQVYIPQVRNELIPKLGQHFDTLEEVQTFYNNYGRESGFGTRINSSKKSRDNQIIRKEYCCYKEGLRKPKGNNVEPSIRKRGLTREGCGAKLAVVKDKSGVGFVVSQFFEGHNHPLTTPKRVHLLHSHREVSNAKKALTAQLSAANVPTCQQMSILAVQSGGIENVGCSQQDLYNAERDRRKVLLGQDANMLLEHFKAEQKNNPAFTYAIKEDDEGKLSHCFWADATSRKSYQYFGDVVVFDTTYKTNRYKMMFAPLLGVNHHGQTTLFGCAFLNDELTSSFEWLFNEWLKAMPAGPPKMIITDQDPAMTKAIATTLPNTHHRYCIWHIVNKFSEKLGAISYKEHYDEFKTCIWNSETPEEFEARWVQVVEKANLSDNEWLKNMFNIRGRWVPVYMNRMFSAHMTSSQRAEISHAFFKRYLSPNNSLWDFLSRFERALATIRHNELDLDHKDINEKPILKTLWGMEDTMSQIYTRKMFYKFQDEIFQLQAYEVTLTFEGEDNRLYNVKRDVENAPKGREVSVEKSSNYVTCSCRMFETDGIPCRHILAYFNYVHVRKLPDNYILRRWTKSAKAGRVREDLGGGGRKEICDTSVLMRRSKLFLRSSNVIDEAVLTEEGSKIYDEALDFAESKLAALKISMGEDAEESVVGESIPLATQDSSLKEPNVARPKGGGKRLKGGKEKSVKKKRRCNGCGLVGVSHDKRNCPKLLALSSQPSQIDDDDEDDDDESMDYDED